ncbi:MAG: SHOCT domain-containing protein [Geothrix sp.]|nr:SHOCT domain-containing protein [Geothrix sp.]
MSLTMLLLAPAALRAVEAERTEWKLSSLTWVKRVPAEAGAPANAHPATLPEGAIQALLGPVQVKDDGKDIPLFGKEDLKGLAKALSEAFALARPGEDLVLFSTSKHGGGFFERTTGLTARLFVREGALNLIVHDARLDFMDRYLVDAMQPTLTYGSRQKASEERLQAPQATRLRGDWLALPLVAEAPAPAPVVAAAPVPVPVPAPVKPSPVPAPAAPDPAFFEAQTQRLKALKRLRDENLISEAEYQEKREAILKTL